MEVYGFSTKTHSKLDQNMRVGTRLSRRAKMTLSRYVLFARPSAQNTKQDVRERRRRERGKWGALSSSLNENAFWSRFHEVLSSLGLRNGLSLTVETPRKPRTRTSDFPARSPVTHTRSHDILQQRGASEKSSRMTRTRTKMFCARPPRLE